MPKVNGPELRALVAEADWSTSDMANMLELAEGSLRNVIAGREPMSDRKIHRAARLLTVQLRKPVTYGQLVADNNEGVPEEPPPQPKPEPKPKRRKEPGGPGPRRDSERGAA